MPDSTPTQAPTWSQCLHNYSLLWQPWGPRLKGSRCTFMSRYWMGARRNGPQPPPRPSERTRSRSSFRSSSLDRILSISPHPFRRHTLPCTPRSVREDKLDGTDCACNGSQSGNKVRHILMLSIFPSHLSLPDVARQALWQKTESNGTVCARTGTSHSNKMQVDLTIRQTASIASITWRNTASIKQSRHAISGMQRLPSDRGH